ncbi:hypothetical protein F383_18985 [Gossypium arboreum]|uniref:Uncharacterized protein n=1 Tax=Gossypium arboreum TaxID=29729 RepID=A0A0B0NLX6_GOSAR|nr:hypothetical protein F383_18985 [Gossypium arboreum]
MEVEMTLSKDQKLCLFQNKTSMKYP